MLQEAGATVGPPPTEEIDVTRTARYLILLSLAALLPASLLLPGCGADAPGPVQMSATERDDWEIRLVEMRIDKNERFRDPKQSPLPPDQIPVFRGLNYFYPAPGFRWRVRFEPEASPDTVLLEKAKGRRVPYVRRGRVRFKHEGKVYSLRVYGPADTTEGDYLWLPFYDKTNGKLTYAGGRYLDLTVDEDGLVDLDFNFAYNPLCDYNHQRYDCTLPPEENRLPFEVLAGEKEYSLVE